MKIENETCVQRVKVVFFQSKSSDSQRDQIHSMIRTFQEAHDDWNVYATGRRIVLETTTLDFRQISNLLESNGLSHSDYDLRVEYERKWGML